MSQSGDRVTTDSLPRDSAGSQPPRYSAQPGGVWRERLAWLVAAAALLACLGLGARRPAPRALSPAEQRRALLASAKDVVQIPVQPASEVAGHADPSVTVAGELIWSQETQQGFLRVEGLEANNAELQQYQVWIVDESRDVNYPVSGGVFDVPAGVQEVIVPVRPSLFVFEPRVFAVTREEAGGVVKSDQQELILLLYFTAP